MRVVSLIPVGLFLAALGGCADPSEPDGPSEPEQPGDKYGDPVLLHLRTWIDGAELRVVEVDTGNAGLYSDSWARYLVATIPGVDSIVPGNEAFDSTLKRFYFKGWSSATTARLYTVDVDAGTALFQPDITSLNANGFEFEPRTGMILAYTADTAATAVLRIDPGTGSADTVAVIPEPGLIRSSNTAFDPGGERYFLYSSTHSRLITVDVVSGAAVGQHDIGAVAVDIEYDPANDIIIALGGGYRGDLGRISPDSGGYSYLHMYPAWVYEGAAFDPFSGLFVAVRGVPPSLGAGTSAVDVRRGGEVGWIYDDAQLCCSFEVVQRWETLRLKAP